jgi:Na+-driven multidrug efflux pump
MLLALTTTFVFTLPLAFVLAYHVDLGPVGVWTALLLHSLVTTTATVGWLVTRPWARAGRAAAR